MDEASEFPDATEADDKYEYFSLVLRIDKSRVSPANSSSLILPHHQAPSAKSLEEDQKTNNLMDYRPDNPTLEPSNPHWKIYLICVCDFIRFFFKIWVAAVTDGPSDPLNSVQDVTLDADEFIQVLTTSTDEDESTGTATDPTTYIPDEFVLLNQQTARESSTTKSTSFVLNEIHFSIIFYCQLMFAVTSVLFVDVYIFLKIDVESHLSDLDCHTPVVLMGVKENES